MFFLHPKQLLSISSKYYWCGGQKWLLTYPINRATTLCNKSFPSYFILICKKIQTNIHKQEISQKNEATVPAHPAKEKVYCCCLWAKTLSAYHKDLDYWYHQMKDFISAHDRTDEALKSPQTDLTQQIYKVGNFACCWKVAAPSLQSLEVSYYGM